MQPEVTQKLHTDVSNKAELQGPQKKVGKIVLVLILLTLNISRRL